jgi:ubiquinone/menaquinone biosynthesis C-methylase UbiE
MLLDVGCGDGGDCELFSKFVKKVVGTDINFHQNWIKIMEKRINIDFIISDACNLPFPNETFDLVYVKDVLHHIQNHEDALEEIIRVTKTGGQIIIIESNRYNPISHIHLTLIKDHEHFSKNFFYQLIERHFNNFEFFTIDSHVFCVRNKTIIKLLHYFEDFLEKIPIINNYLNYNIAIAIKEGVKK